ncbi:MAG: flagellar protein FlaI [Patescibacteria group bacterium]|jgi:flagellar protein FlaI
MEQIKINLTPKAPSIPRVDDKTQINVRYMVIAPFVSIHIYWDPKISEVVYDVEEPILEEGSKEQLLKIEQAMQEMININLTSTDKSDQDLLNYIQKSAEMIAAELGFSIKDEEFKKIIYFLFRNFVGLNEIEPLMRDYFIEDIECNGMGQPIYIVHRIFRNIKTTLKFNEMDALSNFVEKLAQKSGRHVSYASPILDGSLPDGSRVNATYTKDISSKGPTFTIRKFTKVPWTPIQLLGFNTISPEMLAYFWILLQYKANIMIVGGTASGKTTLLNAIAFFIPPENRVVSIEDTRELNLPRENWLPSVVRTGLTEGGTGDVDMFSLLRGSFRQNPDYVIVGEVRGKEASVLFQGMASGHASISTLHADSVQAIVNRLSTPPISLSPTLINSLDVVAVQTHAIVGGQETRRLREIIEINKVNNDGTFVTNTPFKWNPGDDRFYQYAESTMFDKIAEKIGVPKTQLVNEYQIRTKLIYNLYVKKVIGYEEVQKVLSEYSKNPKKVLHDYGVV